MVDFSERMEDISRTVGAFRVKHESMLLKSLHEITFTKSPKDTDLRSTVNTKPQHVNDLSRVFSTECVIMPQPSNDNGYQKLWPLALVFSHHKNMASVGNIESSGSLWKLMQRKDTFPGYRVILQTSEIGDDNIRYLGKGLNLVSLKGDAAIWNVKLAAKSANHISTVDPSDPSRVFEKGGVFVQFEFVETVAVSNTSARDAPQSSVTTPPPPSTQPSRVSPSLLGVSTNEVLGESELIVCTTERGKEPPAEIIDEQGLRFHRSYVWEVMPEAWIDAEMDFLDGHV